MFMYQIPIPKHTLIRKAMSHCIANLQQFDKGQIYIRLYIERERGMQTKKGEIQVVRVCAAPPPFTHTHTQTEIGGEKREREIERQKETDRQREVAQCVLGMLQGRHSILAISGGFLRAFQLFFFGGGVERSKPEVKMELNQGYNYTNCLPRHPAPVV